MVGQLLPVVIFRATDANGDPISGAELHTYLTGTTVPAAVYTASGLVTPLPNPVPSDSAGLFPEVFLDPTITYRFDLKDGSGALIQTVDPYSPTVTPPNGSITGAMLAVNAAAVNLGYFPVNKGGDTLGGELVIGYALSAPPATQSVGFRGMPPVVQNANYAFSFDDPGRLFIHSDANPYAWTIPLFASVGYPAGTVIAFRNRGSGIITLTRTGGVTLTISGSGTSKDVAVAQNGAGALICEGLNTWYATGTGLS